MSAFNTHLAGATERSFSSSLSPDRVIASSEDDNAAALDPELYKSLADKRTTRGMDSDLEFNIPVHNAKPQYQMETLPRSEGPNRIASLL
jgi:hypothetical protein